MAGAVLVAVAGPAHARCADLALVLAIDASGSIDPAEFALQQQGYALAFRTPRVQSALAAAGIVDIGVVLWGDTEMRPSVMPFQRLTTVADTKALAGRIAMLPREVHGNTGIGRGVAAAIEVLEAPEVCAFRKVVNVSGDGPETLAPRPRRHVSLAAARQRAGDLGITINALAIETDLSGLDQWYRDNLIVGPDAFVMRVDGFDSFADAIVEKLDREIRPPQLARVQPVATPAPNRVAVAASSRSGP